MLKKQSQDTQGSSSLASLSTRSNDLSICSKLFGLVCPCFAVNRLTEEKYQISEKNEETKEDMVAAHVGRDAGNYVTFGDRSAFIGEDHWPGSQDNIKNDKERTGRPKALVSSAHQAPNVAEVDDVMISRTSTNKWNKFPVYRHEDNKLIALGKSGKLLAFIDSKKVSVSAIALERVAKAASHIHETAKKPESYGNLDKFWDKRYYLFQKFDEGISLDEKSWNNITPEAISEYIAGKIKCQTILDGFCGAGGNAIKLANTCSRVIANDIDKKRLKCLSNNAKVYAVDNIEMLNQDFMHLTDIQPDVIFLNPEVTNLEQTLRNNILSQSDFKPSLSQIIHKSLQLSRNIVMLLPSHIDVDELADLVCKESIKMGINSATCSMKIEKIFYLNQLKYVAIFLGQQVQSSITINDELGYIYEYLKEDKGPFQHRKIIKEIREQYGMINLLNYVLASQQARASNKSPQPKIDKFYDYIISKKLISQEKLACIKKQQQKENEKYSQKKVLEQDHEVMEEEKYVGEDDEKTISYYSMGGSNPNRCSTGKDSNGDKQADPKEVYNITTSGVTKSGFRAETLDRGNTIDFSPPELHLHLTKSAVASLGGKSKREQKEQEQEE